MTPAERQQLKRDRTKAGLARLEVWVPAERREEIKAAIAAMLDTPQPEAP